MPSISREFFTLSDGVRMAIYHRPGVGVPIFCIPGLTRNHRDFLPLLETFAERPFYLCDLRGRGASDCDPNPENYRPETYAADIAAWVHAHAKMPMDWVGTSLGGILTMALAGQCSIRRAVINDIGPVIETSGLDAIRNRVGKAETFANWEDAQAAVIAGQRPDHPRELDWAERTRALCVERNGHIEFDYDPAIRQQAQGGDIPPFWPFYEQLHQIPTLVIRGESSDLLSESTYQQMLATHPNAQGVIVGQTGHAPTLKEPEAQAALTAFLN